MKNFFALDFNNGFVVKYLNKTFLLLRNFRFRKYFFRG
jgi:hypothetical protein